MWWLIVTASYIAIAFLVFKAKYNRDMAQAILQQHEAEEAYAAEEERIAQEQRKRHLGGYYGAVSVGIEYQRRDARRRVNEREPLFDAIPLGVGWPVYIFWGLGKLLYQVVFDNDIDKVARKRADKLIAEHLRVKELEAENKRLMALAKEEGLIDEHS